MVTLRLRNRRSLLLLTALVAAVSAYTYLKLPWAEPAWTATACHGGLQQRPSMLSYTRPISIIAMLRRPVESAQYTSTAYGGLLSAHEARQSVGRPGTCWDNAVAESFFATLKIELIYRHVWPTRRHAELAIFEFIAGWYNQYRRHSTLGYRSPAEVERCTSLGTLAA